VTLRAGVDNAFNRRYCGFLALGYTFAGTPRTLGLNAKIRALNASAPPPGRLPRRSVGTTLL